MKLYIEKALNFDPATGFSIMTILQLTRNCQAVPNLVPNDFWLFSKIKSALKGQRFQDTAHTRK
jgi:hypothetical protein